MSQRIPRFRHRLAVGQPDGVPHSGIPSHQDVTIVVANHHTIPHVNRKRRSSIKDHLRGRLPAGAGAIEVRTAPDEIESGIMRLKTTLHKIVNGIKVTLATAMLFGVAGF